MSRKGVGQATARHNKVVRPKALARSRGFLTLRDRVSPPQLSILFLLLLLAGCIHNPQARKEKFYNHGLQLVQKGKSRQAAIEFRNALRIDPNFVEAASSLAELEFRERNYRQAYSLLLQAVKAKPDYLPPHKGLAQIYRLAGKLVEAKQETDYVLERAPEDIDALFNLGIIQAQESKPTEAEETFNRILTLQPRHAGALLALASVSKDRQDSAGAEHYLKLALERNPRSVVVYLALLKFYISSGRFTDAEPLFSQAINATDGSTEILDAQLGYYEGRGKLAEAEGVARKIQSSHRSDPKYRDALADFLVQTNQWNKAATELERLAHDYKDDPVTLHKLIEARLALDDRKTAEGLNERLLKNNPKDALAHLVKGRLYLADGEFGKALLQFNEAQKFYPSLPELHYWYAQAHLQQNEIEQAKQSLATALRYDPNYHVARLKLAQLEEQTGALEAALSDVKHLLSAKPVDSTTMLFYSNLLISKQDYSAARTILDSMGGTGYDIPEKHRQLAVLALVEKNPAAAQKEFLAAWNLDPESRPLLEDVLKNYLAEKHAGRALNFLNEQVERRPNDPLLYHELGQVLLLQNKRPQAEQALEKALQIDPNAADTAILLADLYAKEKKSEQAVKTIKRTLGKQPRDASLLLRAGMVFEEAQDWEEARNAYERVLALDNDNAVAANNTAWLLVAHGGNIDRALTLAQQAEERLNHNLQVENTMGWVYYKKGLYQTAWKYLTDCAQADPTNAAFQYELGMTCWKLGKRDEARTALLNALRLDPSLPEKQSAREVLSQL